MANLTQNQLRYLALAWACFEAEPKVDYTRYATLTGSKTPNSAREMLRMAKKAVKELEGSGGGGGNGAAAAAPSVVAKAGVKLLSMKAKAKVNANGTNGTNGTKAGGGRKRKRDVDQEEEEEAEAEVGGQETPAPQKKKGGKGVKKALKEEVEESDLEA